MNNEQFMVLHRHWMWSNVLKQHFIDELNQKKIIPSNVADKWGAYMFLWYATLFSVLETFNEYGITFPEIQDDINSIYQPLKRLRNAVLHPQPKYWSPKITEFISLPDTAKKTRIIHSYLGGYFLREIEKRKNK